MISRSEVPSTLSWKLTIAAAAVIFVILAAWNISLPGLYYDEAIQIAPALRFVKPDMQGDAFGEQDSEIVIRGHRLPLMSMGYLGGLKTIAFVPLAATGKLGVRSIRSFTLLIGALALIAISAFARRFLGPAAAALGAILLATDPGYLFFSRTDFGPTVLMMLLKGTALWQLTIWWQTGRSWPLYRAAFAIGLGVWDKTNFLWIVLAAAGAVLLIAPRSFARLKVREAMLAGCLFVLGCLPLIVYNLHWPPPTWTALKNQNINGRRNETGAPHSFRELEGRVLQRAKVLAKLLTASNVDYVRDLPGPPATVMPFVVFAASIITLLCYSMPRLRRRWRREMWLLLAASGIVVAAALTPGAYKAWHLILAYPFPQLIVAAVVVRGLELCRRMRMPVGAICAAAVVLVGAVAPAVAGTLRYRQVMAAVRQTGGAGSWSDGIYELDAWLESHDPSQPVVTVDWGIEWPLVVLSQGRLLCVERWTARDAAAYQEFLNMSGSRYVLHAPDATEFPEGREVFLEAVRSRGLQLDLVNTIADRTGRPVLLVYTASPTIGGRF
jgi:hypothetical protein